MQDIMRSRNVNLRPLVGLLALVVMLILGVLLLRQSAPEQVTAPAYWPTGGWRSSNPEEQGIDSVKLAEGLLAMRKQDLDIHSLLMVRNGYIVVDAYFYPYDGSTVHDMASVTKSVMTTLIGIAADQGKLSLDDPALSFFPNRTIANRDALKEQITVRHLASMSSGLDCTHERDEETLQQMQRTTDYVQFTLDRRMMAEPGTRFIYCSPAIHLLSPILQQATGMTALDFARANLFAPLGIEDAIWESDPQGFSDGWGDLYLHPRDMAKLGLLWLNGGEWDGQQVVPREWVAAAGDVQMADTGPGWGDDKYGYGWWIEEGSGLTVIAARGRGGQDIKIVPRYNLMAVTTGGGFDFSDIDPLLLPTLADMERPLPANPEGVAQLQAAVEGVAQPPAAQPVAPLPDMARAISGKTFLFEPNPTDLEAVSLDFDGSAEAAIRHKMVGATWVGPFPVGLDGVFRFSTGDHGLPQGHRGMWADAQTFVIEYDNIANNDHIFYQVRLDGDRVLISVQETAHDVGVELEGTPEEWIAQLLFCKLSGISHFRQRQRQRQRIPVRERTNGLRQQH
jgi:CubicO group peptidase (beta-lactamase class C family)